LAPTRRLHISQLMEHTALASTWCDEIAALRSRFVSATEQITGV
jgi:hypothetical protein